MNDWRELTIGEVSRKAGVAPSAIRYYESIGVLPEPQRGRRHYDESVLGKLAFIGVAQSAGFSLDEIKDLADGIDAGDGMAGQMRTLSAQKLGEVEALLEKLGEVEALLERTMAMKGWLEVAKQCGCDSPAECALFPVDEGADTGLTLPVVNVEGGGCRRPPA
jgi:MerR family redox-sensitive transcriptional activator SoxR